MSNGNRRLTQVCHRQFIEGTATLFRAALNGSETESKDVLAASKSRFVLWSPDPQLAISVPRIYTAKAFGCTGGNLSPPLHWSGTPTGTKSFVVTNIRPLMETFSLERAAEAYDRMMNGKARFRVVITTDTNFAAQ
jgi:hypothetical protein